MMAEVVLGGDIVTILLVVFLALVILVVLKKFL